MRRSIGWSLSLVTVASLMACGGGGGDAGSSAPSSMTFAGTAASGAAIAGGTVELKCAAGTGTATTGADGKYSLTLTEATLPCALRVTAADGTVYHSVQAGTGTSGSFNVNITPLTELLVAKLAGADPQGFFDAFASGTPVSAEAVAQAVDALKTVLAGLVDLSGVNPLTDVLEAANGANAGNALDQKLDALAAVVAAAGITLADVTTAIAANPGVPEGINQVLQPAAQACSRLHSGKYRMINPYESDPEWQAHVLTIDAAALTYVDHTGVTGSVVSDGPEACSFTGTDSDGTSNKILVSSAGILVVYSTDTGGNKSVTIGLPEQTVPVAELEGTWNMLWFGQSDPNVAGYVAEPGLLTLDATGQITASSVCIGLAECTAEAGPFGQLVARSDGGFGLMEAGAAAGRLHAFKAPNGTYVAVAIGGDDTFLVATKQRAIATLPTVGDVNKVWDFNVNGNASVSALNEYSLTITAVDTAATSFTRIRSSDNRVDTMTDNKPRDGMRYRAPNSCSMNGAPMNCAGTTVLPLQGLGMSVSGSIGTSPANSFYGVTVVKP
jgi:hypothetical protein